MSSLEKLIQKAKHLHSEGHSPGQIADELSLSMETVTWLLTQQKGTEAPKDVHIDWTAVSSSADLLRDTALMQLKRYYADEEALDEEFPEVVVGIALSGVPLATVIAAEEDLRLAVYHPTKHSTGEQKVGSFSGNFAQVHGKKCLVVDDVITSGKTMREVVGNLRRQGATPLAILVLFDKQGLPDVEGVPVYSLFRVSRV